MECLFKFSSHRAVVFLSVFLVACGGGSSDQSDNDGNSSYSFSDVADYASVNAYSLSESLLQVGLLAENIISSNNDFVITEQQDCSNGGFSKITFNDNDGDNYLSSGDAISIQYDGCYISSLDDTADGVLKINIINYKKDTNSASVKIDMSNLEVSDSPIVVTGIIDLSFDNTSNKASVSLSSADKISLYYAGSVADNISNFSVKRTVDYSTSIYSMSSSGVIDDELTNLNYSFEQNTPWSGYILEYPTAGKMTITSSGGKSIVISTDEDKALGVIRQDWNNQENFDSWDDYSDGVLWSFNFGDDPEPEIYQSDNFRFVGYLNSEKLHSFPTKKSIEMVFSRPVKNLDDIDDYQIYYDTNSGRIFSSVNFSINGAIVTIMPNNPLTSGETYTFPGFGVEDGEQAYVNTDDFTVTASDAVKAKMSLQSGVFRPGDTPWLSAENSIMNSGSKLSYQWLDASNSGIEFSNENGIETTFTVPNSLAKDITVKLIVSNEHGDSDTVERTIYYIDPDLNRFIANMSEPDDAVGMGEPLLFEADKNGNVVTSINKSSNQIEIWGLGDPFTEFYVVSPDITSLEIGEKYKVDSLYQDSVGNITTFKFGEYQRYCSNGGSGEFTVYQMELDDAGNISSFAANFRQQCDDMEGSSYGVIRVNSDYPLNP